jgi:polysaccharide pyruvyl transferase WcaK-like protein
LGNFGSGNLGNDGSLEAMLDFLRRARPDAELVCICSGPSKVRELYEISAIPIRKGRYLQRLPFVRAVLNFLYMCMTAKKLDVLIAPGTGLLDDFADSPWGMPASLLSWCATARMRGAHVAFVSIGAGPVANPLSRSLTKAAAKLAHYRSYRDVASKKFMQSIGLDVQHDPIYPDLAFALPRPSAPTPSPAQGNPMTVGLGVMRYRGWRDSQKLGMDIYNGYLHKLVRFVTWLLDQNIRVRLLMGDEVDQVAIGDFLNALASERPDYPRAAVVFEPANTLHDVMHQVAETDLVVATRFHNIVCALKIGKPCISIGYAPKFDALMGEMGLEQFCQHVEQLDIDLLIRQLTGLMADQALYRQKIDKLSGAYRHSLSLQEEALLKSVLA